MAEIRKTGMSQGDLVQFLTDVLEVVNPIRTALVGDNLWTTAALAVGTVGSNIGTGQVTYNINQGQYYKAAASTTPSNSAVPDGTWGLLQVEIGTNGTIDIMSAAANGTGYSTYAKAVAAKPTIQADHVELGYAVFYTSGANFTPGSTSFSAATVSTTFVNATTTLSTLNAANGGAALSLTV